MNRNISPTLVEILRATLSAVEKELDLPENDPGILELKRLLTRSIGEIEARRIAASAEPRRHPDPS